MKTSLALALVLFSALPGRADDPAVVPALTQEDVPAPQLVELADKLTRKQEDKTKGVLPPEEYREFIVKFRAELDVVIKDLPLTPANRGLHARIIARLGEQESDQALARLERALKDDPDNPALLRAKAQVLFDKKDYPAAAAAARQAGATALALLKMSEGREADLGVRAEPLPRERVGTAAPEAESNLPYKLAVRGGVKPVDVPSAGGMEPNPPLHGGRPMISNATGLWDRASDGLVMRGSQWLGSAEASGENGISGLGKFGRKGVGKAFVAAGGIMEALPGTAGWAADAHFRLITGDVTVVADVSKGAYHLGKTAVVGFAADARVAAADWADLLTLKNPTTYQALKATARTEAILANFLPVGLTSRGARVGAATAESVGESAGRRALAGRIAAGGREIGEEAARRAAVGVEERAIARFTVDRIKVTPRGVEAVEEHLARFEADAPNAAMVDRLKRISRGELAATRQDLQFYAHELREKVLYRRANIPDGAAPYEAGRSAHARALKEYGLTNEPNELYHAEAGVAAEDARILKKYGLSSDE